MSKVEDIHHSKYEGQAGGNEKEKTRISKTV
jgi:hypothetical protein